MPGNARQLSPWDPDPTHDYINLLSFGNTFSNASNVLENILAIFARAPRARGTIYVPPHTSNYNLLTSVTIPVGITLLMDEGAVFNIASGKTLTIKGNFEGVPSQHFTGSGTVLFTGTRVEAINPEWWGAVGDGQYVADGSVTNASTTLTSATAAFTSADVGKLIVIEGGAVTGYPHYTTIASVTNSTTIVLTAAAGRTQSSASVKWGTDDTTAIQSAITAARAGHMALEFSPRLYFITSALTLATNDVWTGTLGRSVIVAGTTFAGAMLTDGGTIIYHATMQGLTIDAAGIAAKCVYFPNSIGYVSQPYLNPYQTIGGEISYCNFIGWTDTGFQSGAHGGAKLHMHDCRIRGFIGPTGAVVAGTGLDIDQSDSWFHDLYINAFTAYGVRDRTGVNWWSQIHVDGGTGVGVRFENADHHLTDSEIDMSNNPAAPTYAVELAGYGNYYIHNNTLRAGHFAGSAAIFFSDDSVGAAGIHYRGEITENFAQVHPGGSALPFFITGDAGVQIQDIHIAHNNFPRPATTTVTVFLETELQGFLTMLNGQTNISGTVNVIGGQYYVTLGASANVGYTWYTLTPGASGGAGTLRIDSSVAATGSVPISYWIRTCYGIPYPVA